MLLAALREPPGGGGRRLLLYFAGLDVLNVLVYPISFALAYGEMGGFSPLRAWEAGGRWTVVFSLAILLRAVVLAGLGISLLGSAGDGPGPLKPT